MKFNILITLITITSFTVTAQYRAIFEGHIVTMEGDTIAGRFRLCDDWLGCALNKFKPSNGVKLKIKVKQISSYMYNDYLFERKTLYSTRTVFMRLVKDGDQKLYEHAYVSKNSNEFGYSTEVDHQDYYMETNHVLVKVKKKSREFRKMMKY